MTEEFGPAPPADQPDAFDEEGYSGLIDDIRKYGEHVGQMGYINRQNEGVDVEIYLIITKNGYGKLFFLATNEKTGEVSLEIVSEKEGPGSFYCFIACMTADGPGEGEEWKQGQGGQPGIIIDE